MRCRDKACLVSTVFQKNGNEYMDLCEYKIMQGGRHPWEIARAKALKSILDDTAVLGGGSRVLDIGCGDGFTINSVCGGVCGTIDAVDSSLTPELIADFSARYSSVNFHNSLAGLGNNYNLITAFDVIEHNEDDFGFLQSIIEHAASGANILLTAPAFNSLFSQHDVMLKHYRRYNKKELAEVVERAGLRVKCSGYLFGSLLLCRFVMKKFQRVIGSSGAESKGLAAWKYGELLTDLVVSSLSADNYLMLQAAKYGWSMPGLTAWVLCQK